jgi:hypothetical protein
MAKSGAHDRRAAQLAQNATGQGSAVPNVSATPKHDLATTPSTADDSVLVVAKPGPPSGVMIDLAASTAVAGDAAGDQLIGITNLTGSATGARDRVGNGSANLLTDGRDRDVFVGVTGGDDSFIGNDGTEFVDFSSFTITITVNLIAASDTSGDAPGDRFTGIANAFGPSTATNLLVGNAEANPLVCAASNDTCVGSAGRNEPFIGNGDKAPAFFSKCPS